MNAGKKIVATLGTAVLLSTTSLAIAADMDKTAEMKKADMMHKADDMKKSDMMDDADGMKKKA